MLTLHSALLLSALLPSVLGRFSGHGEILRRSSPPQVALDYVTLQGSSVNSTDSFLGIPFAQPPTGNLRFRLPRSPKNIPGVYNATSFGNACPQQAVFNPNEVIPNIPGFNVTAIGESSAIVGANVSEDCLYLNVVRPASLSANAKVPVLVWLYGGGFETGAASTPSTNGIPVVERSVALGEPVIFVSLNYRLNVFGFLGGKEVKEAGLGNIGLHDQRFALQWVQKHIGKFGGDPTKVILWGESAGSISIVAQMASAQGQADGLFRGAVLESGFPSPITDITESQGLYDQIVAATNCSSLSSASNSSSTLNCLRAAPYETIMSAVNNTPSLFSYEAPRVTWGPQVDGVFLNRTFREAFAGGYFTKMPIIAGDCDDEGTIFSLFSLNITTDEQFSTFVPVIIPGINASQTALIEQVYSSDPSQGSPFGTGTNSSLTPEFKRISAFSGDATFQAPRRFMLDIVSKTQDAWSFLYKRGKSIPYLGSYHSSDIAEFFASGATPDYIATDALINFAYNLNPNAASNRSTGVQSGLQNLTWPQWSNSSGSPSLLTFTDPDNVTITLDNYRSRAMDVINEIETQLGL